jgi:hypothetical protein
MTKGRQIYEQDPHQIERRYCKKEPNGATCTQANHGYEHRCGRKDSREGEASER